MNTIPGRFTSNVRLVKLSSRNYQVCLCMWSLHLAAKLSTMAPFSSSKNGYINVTAGDFGLPVPWYQALVIDLLDAVSNFIHFYVSYT